MHTRKIFYWLGIMAALVLVYTAGTTQMQKPGGKGLVAKNDQIDQDGDTIEAVGMPTGEDPWIELEKIIAAYYSKTGMAYKGTIKVIDDNYEKEKVLEEHVFEYSMVENSYQSRIGETEFINTRNSLMVIDHAAKTISYSPGAGVIKKNRLMDIRDFKKLMLEQNVNARITRLGEEKILTIDNINDPDIQGYRIYYSPASYRINKMLIGMARLSPLEEPEENEVSGNEAAGVVTEEDIVNEYYYYLEVIYESIRDLAIKEKEFNPEKKFIRITNGKPELMPGYEDYQFLSTIEP